jgi:hypothetical protein
LYENRRLEAVTDISQARLLALALMLVGSLDGNQRSTVLRQWEMVTFRIFGMYRKDARTKVGDYTRLAHRVISEHLSYGTIMKELRLLGEDYPVADGVEQLRNTDCYEGWEDRLRYFLYRYEEHLADKAGSTISQELWEQIWQSTASRTIEHIYPQQPGPRWKKITPKMIHRLGNLLVLPPGINSRASNKAFYDKKDIYKSNYLRMMEEILVRNDWSSAAIEEREERLLAWAKKAWADVPVQ